ncbi:MAG: GTP cyclohydrolase II [Deltaproteobacteria bacterium]|nr:GTP cyclohydrolase II [Deltaproteobacteria bacterium]
MTSTERPFVADTMVERFAETMLPTVHGALRCIVYRDGDGVEHLAMVAGEPAGDDVLVRVHSECLTGEVLGSTKCDCKAQLDRALDLIARRGRGVVVYLRQEGRGIGLGNKIRAYALQEQGHDTVDANRLLGFPDDARDYAVAAAILAELGVRSVALLTNNPLKAEALEEQGVRVLRRVPHLVEVRGLARRYLEVKGRRMGHLLEEGTTFRRQPREEREQDEARCAAK